MHSLKMPSCILIVAALTVHAVFGDMARKAIGTTTELGNRVSATFLLDWDGTNLIVRVSNTSQDRSVITGWALMGGSTGTGFGALGTLNDGAWFQANNLSLSPPKQFGVFDFGADTLPLGLNAGNPRAGVLAGTTATFTFYNLRTLADSARDFLTTLNNNGLALVARWQSVGPDGRDSAKAGGAGADEPIVVPAPGSALLACIGLQLVSRWRRRCQ